MFPKYPKTSPHGSFLIELLVSIGIVALLFVISLPMFRQYQPNLKLRAEAKQLIYDLRFTQQLTVTEQKIHYLEMNIATGSYQVMREEESPAPPTLIKSVTLNEDVDFQQITGLTDNKVVFNSYGAVSESGNIILVNSNEKITTILVKSSGYVQWSN